ncbi:hypothetical protein WN48_09977 [Eufriesea mexicana]|uniref:Uncharacterized protein n=1 Tax=Eufriesea mexicana TaxID=516756 RepID=A0A310SJ04_9HYME|nr:hypothetical protein WN48_09977 [Eufriesea mexicana]
MKLTVSTMILLAIFSNALALDLNRFFWHGNQPQKPEEVQVVEIVRWRQQVCVKPAKGVSSCLYGHVHTPKKPQSQYEQVIVKDERKGGYEVWTAGESQSRVSSMDVDPLSEIASSEVISSFPLEILESSRGNEEFFSENTSGSSERTSVLTENEERNLREGRHLLPHPDKATKPKQIYVTKVLNSPITATLVAYNCLPEIGVPLCESHEENDEDSKSSSNLKPSLTISLAKPNIFGQEVSSDIPEESRNLLPNKISIQSFGESAEKTKPEIVIRNPDFGQTSTSFTLDYVHTTNAPKLEHIVISNINKPVISNAVHIAEFLSNVSRSNFVNSAKEEISSLLGQPELAVGVSKIVETVENKGTEETEIMQKNVSKEAEIVKNMESEKAGIVENTALKEAKTVKNEESMAIGIVENKATKESKIMVNEMLNNVKIEEKGVSKITETEETEVSKQPEIIENKASIGIENMKNEALKEAESEKFEVSKEAEIIENNASMQVEIVKMEE